MTVKTSSNTDNLFIPNFCTGKAVFMLALVSELLAIVQVLIWSDHASNDWQHLATFSLFVQWIALTSSALLCIIRPYLKKRSIIFSTMAMLLTVTIATLVFTATAQWLLSLYDGQVFPDLHQLSRNCLVSLILTAILTRYFYIQHKAQTQQQAAHNARFEALQARMHPHFLFNSMNTIASLIHSDQQKAEQAVEDLSDLFRIILQDYHTTIPLEREIDVCQRYLRIEKARLGKRLRSHWAIDSLPDGITLPPLTLQPVIENAVYHGIQPLEKGGLIEITIKLQANQLTIQICNPMSDKISQSSGHRIALDNIRSRLVMLYGHSANIETTNYIFNDNRYFKTSITLPYISNL